MNKTLPPTLRIAILINGLSPLRPKIKSAFTTSIKTHIPAAEVDFYDPIEAQTYPDPAQYDLIVLSGGTVDPMSQEPWVLKMHEFLRETVEKWPTRKIVGICWGHQTIQVAFGGVVEGMGKGRAEIGIHDIPLLPSGSAFFICLPSPSHLTIHEYHARQVSQPAAGFVALAENNQVFVNEANTILTMQGHPEMSEELAKEMLAHTPSYMGVGEEEKGEMRRRMEGANDGGEVWRRILEWVDE